MKYSDFMLAVGVAAIVMVFLACKKEHSCESCRRKNNPVANAGPDRVVLLPSNSTLLDGSASSDTDGQIVQWHWRKIAGPDLFQMAAPDSSVTAVSNLDAGIFRFELTVKDNDGLTAMDTMQVMVRVSAAANRPPVAHAGSDSLIVLPSNAIELDGRQSSDPDNNISDYQWQKISGPDAYVFANQNLVSTLVGALTEGVYRFALKVTDEYGLQAADTVQIAVLGASPYSCSEVGRPAISIRMEPESTIPDLRARTGVVYAGNRIFIAGGTSNWFNTTARVDIYDLHTKQWSIAYLSKARADVKTVVAENKIYFIGGFDYDPDDPDAGDNPIPVGVMDIFDLTTNTWSTAALIRNLNYDYAAAAGGKVFLSGGQFLDIYDIHSGAWSGSVTSDGRTGAAIAATSSKAYFAGGTVWLGGSRFGPVPVNTVDVYDILSQQWHTLKLSQAKTFSGWRSGVAIGDQVYFAGGYITPNMNYPPHSTSCTLDIYDGRGNSQSVSHLSRQWRLPGTLVANGKQLLFIKDAESPEMGQILDIYDAESGKWSIGQVDKPLFGSSLVSANGNLYSIGGHFWNGISLNQIYRLEY